MLHKEAYQKYLASLGGPSPLFKKEVQKKLPESASKDSKQLEESKKDEDVEKNPEEDEDYKEAQRIKDIIDRKIREKIAKGKLAYAIGENKKTMRLPMMQEKALNEKIEDDHIHSKLFSLTTTVFAKGRTLSRESRPMTRNFHIASPRELSQRRHFEFSSDFRRFSLISPSDVPILPTPAPYIKEVENENFLMGTVSSINKTEEQIIPSWKINHVMTPVKKHKWGRINLSVNKKDETPRILKKLGQTEKKNPWIPVARRFSY